MLKEIAIEAIGGIATIALLGIGTLLKPYSQKLLAVVWQWFRTGIMADYARFKALSRRRKVVVSVLNIYCIGAIIAANTFGPDAPWTIQIWASTVMLFVICGCAWLAVIGTTRKVRQLVA